MASDVSSSTSSPADKASQATMGARAFLFLAGLVALVIGVLVIADPNRTLRLISIVFGIYLLVWGLVKLYRTGAEETKTARGVSFVLGLLAVAAGIVVLIRPTGTLKAVAWAFGIYLLALGVVTVIQSLAAPEDGPVHTVVGLVDLAGGIVVVAWPSITLWVLAVVLGIYLIVRGVLTMGVALAAHPPRHTEPATTP